ncbi:hypothetical protein GCM10009021_27740 [Halarchaeum nitratireducens]|uniref:Uncharacterized protein n=1 Tax=Halarchaeum nitratireducens TaxID=489913 RepID=A0A830GFL2_9EURY|nr:hypothetical protein GCM10009021_27740 [Halarchaeum nitratireducens]
MLGVIDEKHGVGDIVFLTKLPQKLLRQCRRSRRKQPSMEEFVRFGIDGGVQPELLSVDSDLRFVECDVIRTRIAGWL